MLLIDNTCHVCRLPGSSYIISIGNLRYCFCCLMLNLLGVASAGPNLKAGFSYVVAMGFVI